MPGWRRGSRLLLGGCGSVVVVIVFVVRLATQLEQGEQRSLEGVGVRLARGLVAVVDAVTDRPDIDRVLGSQTQCINLEFDDSVIELALATTLSRLCQFTHVR